MHLSNRTRLLISSLMFLNYFANLPAAIAQSDLSLAKNRENLQTTDYLVPHVSTVPANAGKHVELFVREKVGSKRAGKAPVVLMIGGATVPAVPVFDVQFENYSWMEYLAAAGFDVFILDFQGYGLSPRPMMDDPCNYSTADQTNYLVPKTIPKTCAPSYPFALTTIQSDWDEIETVVEYLRRLRGVDKVNLVGYSRGGARAGGYAAKNPVKVEKLFLLAPGRYFRLTPDNPPAVLPVAGVPASVLGKDDFYRLTWDLNGGTNGPPTPMCDNQYTPAIRPVITAAQLDSDPVATFWGTAGARRAPNWNSPTAGLQGWGWNASLAGKVTVPTLVIRGDLDTQVPVGDIQDLLGDLTSVPQKVFVHVACSSHYMPWENQHMALLDASVEWLQNGTYQGRFSGSFAVNAAGQIHQE